MAFSNELLDQLLAGCERPEDILGAQGLFAQLKKALAERALGAELGHHLAQEAQAPPPVGRRCRNHRNGSSARRCSPTLARSPSHSCATARAPSSASSSPSNQRRPPGFDAKVLALYARGLTVQEMQAHLEERYGVDVSPDLISTVPCRRAGSIRRLPRLGGVTGSRCPLFAHAPEIRRMLSTTTAIESLHVQLRKALKIRGHFPSDEAASKLIYLVLRNITRRWRQAPRPWKAR